MLILGLLGGIASGKSLVAQQFVSLGAVALNADQIGHEVLLEPEVEAAARERWGDRVFGADQHLDRRAVAKIVFGPAPDGPRELAFLERLTHPRIGARLHARIEQLRSEHVPAAVLDAPVMLKAGWHKFCTHVIFIDADRPIRQQRARLRGWSDTEFDAREAAQESLNEKRRLADWVIDNSGSPERTFLQVQQFWNSLPSIP